MIILLVRPNPRSSADPVEQVADRLHDRVSTVRVDCDVSGVFEHAVLTARNRLGLCCIPDRFTFVYLAEELLLLLSVTWRSNARAAVTASRRHHRPAACGR
jgi:hypothetical protein